MWQYFLVLFVNIGYNCNSHGLMWTVIKWELNSWGWGWVFLLPILFVFITTHYIKKATIYPALPYRTRSRGCYLSMQPKHIVDISPKQPQIYRLGIHRHWSQRLTKNELFGRKLQVTSINAGGGGGAGIPYIRATMCLRFPRNQTWSP